MEERDRGRERQREIQIEILRVTEAERRPDRQEEGRRQRGKEIQKKMGEREIENTWLGKVRMKE